MDPINLKIGTGYHVHEGYDGFNFLKIVIKDKNTFFIETTFIQMKLNEKIIPVMVKCNTELLFGENRNKNSTAYAVFIFPSVIG